MALHFVTVQLSRVYHGASWMTRVSVPVLPKVPVINRSINSLVGRKFHKEVCVCVIREMEKGRGRKKPKGVTRLSESPRCDTDAILVTGKTHASWLLLGHPLNLRVCMSLSHVLCVEMLA